MAGDDANPAVPGYDPDISAELYTTNGETDGARARPGTARSRFTPEMTTCETASAVDPGRPVAARGLRQRLQLPRRRGPDPGRVRQEHPVRAVGRQVRRTTRTTRSRWSAAAPPTWSSTRSTVSYGTHPAGRRDRQAGACKNVRLHYSVNGGRRRSATRCKRVEGRRAVRRHRRRVLRRVPRHGHAAPSPATGRGLVHRRQAAGPAGSAASTSPTQVRTDIGGDVLILAAEDVTGISPVQGVTTREVRRRVRRRTHRGRDQLDVYDVDANSRKAPHPLGVLSHYKAVVWETGDDIIPRAAGQAAGHGGQAGAATSSCRSATTSTRAASCCSRGKYAGFAQAADGAYFYNPFEDQPRVHHASALPVPAAAQRLPAVLAGCLQLRRRRRHRRRRGCRSRWRDGRRRSTASPARSTVATRRTTRTTPRRSCRPRAVLPTAQFPQFASSAPVELGPAGRRAVRARSPATGTCTAGGRTVATSG